MKDNDSELKNIVEAALLAAEEPLGIPALTGLFPEDAAPSHAQLKEVFEELERDYDGRGVELRRVGKGWRFQTREKYSPWLRKLTESRPPRYSRAFLETLAIIAYRQPVTRGDIEEIRGVQVSSDIMRSLMDRDWVKEVGHRDVPGRPALLGTTQQFLEYFNLEALSELPPLLERRDASDIARELNMRLPTENGEEAAPADAANQDDGQPEAGDDGRGEHRASVTPIGAAAAKATAAEAQDPGAGGEQAAGVEAEPADAPQPDQAHGRTEHEDRASEEAGLETRDGGETEEEDQDDDAAGEADRDSGVQQARVESAGAMETASDEDDAATGEEQDRQAPVVDVEPGDQRDQDVGDGAAQDGAAEIGDEPDDLQHATISGVEDRRKAPWADHERDHQREPGAADDAAWDRAPDTGDGHASEDDADDEPAPDSPEDTDQDGESHYTAQVIPFEDALTSREGDGEDS